MFRAKDSHPSNVWDRMEAKMHETILLGSREERDKELSGNEGKILANWGLKNLRTVLSENPT